MAEELYRDSIFLENTKFIYHTNFAGDPNKDKYHNNTRRGNIIIPDEEMALEMREAGYNVKNTQPREGEEEGFVPTYYVPIIIGYKHPKRKPKVVLVTNGVAQELDEENVGTLDDIYVLNVNVTLHPRFSQERNCWTLYVSQIYVEQDVEDDPWAGRYTWNNQSASE